MNLLYIYFIEAFTRFMVLSKKVLEHDDSACALVNFATAKKGSSGIKRRIFGLVPNAQDACAATAFFDPSISELYAGKTMVASLFPVRALAMDKRFCHVKNIMKKYRKTLLHAFSELHTVVLTVYRNVTFFRYIRSIAIGSLYPIL